MGEALKNYCLCLHKSTDSSVKIFFLSPPFNNRRPLHLAVKTQLHSVSEVWRGQVNRQPDSNSISNKRFKFMPTGDSKDILGWQHMSDLCDEINFFIWRINFDKWYIWLLSFAQKSRNFYHWLILVDWRILVIIVLKMNRQSFVRRFPVPAKRVIVTWPNN